MESLNVIKYVEEKNKTINHLKKELTRLNREKKIDKTEDFEEQAEKLKESLNSITEIIVMPLIEYNLVLFGALKGLSEMSPDLMPVKVDQLVDSLKALLTPILGDSNLEDPSEIIEAMRVRLEVAE